MTFSLVCQKTSTISHTNYLSQNLSAYGFDRKSIAIIAEYLKNRKLAVQDFALELIKNLALALALITSQFNYYPLVFMIRTVEN